MRLKDYVSPDRVVLGLDAENVSEAIHALAQRFADHGPSPDPGDLERRLLERERAHTTALGEGIAIPHATVEGLAEPIILIAMAANEIQFGPPGTDPVTVFFVLLSPPGREGEHIKILARICRLARHPGFLDDLGRAESPEDLLRVVEEVDNQHV